MSNAQFVLWWCGGASRSVSSEHCEGIDDVIKFLRIASSINSFVKCCDVGHLLKALASSAADLWFESCALHIIVLL